MKKFLVLVAIAIMAAPAFAQADPDPDGIGVYFDTAGEVLCQPALGFVSANLLITNPTGADLVGFEGEVVIETDVTAYGFQGWTVTGTNAAAAPEFFMAWASPVMPEGNTILVATYGAYPLNGTFMKFFLKPYIAPSVPGKMVYIQSSDPGGLIPLQVPVGDYALPVATIGLPCEEFPVPTEDKSWGQVKSLF